VAQRLAYEIGGWGVGELWLEGPRVVWHELPRQIPNSSAGNTVLFASEAARIVERIEAYFAGEPVSFDDVDLDLEYETEFLTRCAHALRAVPRGEVVTYGELAALAGAPGAARAAGSFCARNRLALFVPCHRVVAAGGLGAYPTLGVEYKRRLLRLEGVPV
jgi:methylated-DNA-[protein]-cysteine S-methyltransferase